MNANVLIRDARQNDFDWVVELMQEALEPYYGGDHRAHAKRIFDAHILGGQDHVGFFSFKQRMFVLEVQGEKAGIIHVVGKRQSTYKISPLILSQKYQGKGGLGSMLLSYAENYAQAHEARQLYCTVAEKNFSAMQFFLRKGFIRAGSSDSHYKNGVTETMLYKPLREKAQVERFDEVNISVIPFSDINPDLRNQVARILLERLPESFEGIDEKWISSLFEGYARRDTADVNSKYKLIFVALDGKGKVVGVAGATPKKGSPIKVMPFIATDNVAFEALLIDIPHQLVSYGHKLYIHINPTVEEVVSLQRLGWKLDAALPGAYRPEITTQQWSLKIGENTMRTMRIKQRFFDLIKSGAKQLEVRVGYDSINRITIGESINLISKTSTMNVRVKDIRKYTNFGLMLEKEPYSMIAPDVSSKTELLKLLRNIYPSDKEKLGVVVLELEVK